MLFDNPEDDARFRKAIHMLADLTDSDAELTSSPSFAHFLKSSKNVARRTDATKLSNFNQSTIN